MANSLNKVTTKSILDATVATADIADDAVTADKLANAINTDIAGKAVLTGSTNNTITTVTGANAIQGEANLTFDGTALSVGGATHGSHSTFSDIFLGGAAHLYAETTGAAGNSLSISQNAHVDSDGSWEYIVTDEASNIYQYSGKIGFRTAPSGTAGNDISWTERLTVANTGDVTVGDGNLVIAGSGHGIDFSAQTASSATGATTGDELLDHYEEGTFTPTLSYHAGSSGVSYTAQQGRYTRIGNVLFFQLRINLDNKGTSSGDNIIFEGLPFTPSVTTVNNSMVQFDAVSDLNLGDDGRMPFCQVQSGGKLYLYSFDYGGTGNYSDITIGHITNDAQLAVSGHYYV